MSQRSRQPGLPLSSTCTVRRRAPPRKDHHVSRTPRFRPTGALVAAGAVLGALALAGCGAGQITQTSTQVPAVAGANAGVGAVVVRDAYIEFGEQAQGANIYPRGGAAPLKMSIVNTGIQPDRLVSASSPAAASVAISGDAEVPPGRVLLIEGGPEAPAAARPRRPRRVRRRARPRPRPLVSSLRPALRRPLRSGAGHARRRDRRSRPGEQSGAGTGADRRAGTRPARRHRRRRRGRSRRPGRPHRTHRGRPSRTDLPGGAELRAGRPGHA